MRRRNYTLVVALCKELNKNSFIFAQIVVKFIFFSYFFGTVLVNENIIVYIYD